MKILDGKKLAAGVLEDLRARILAYGHKGGPVPGLGIIRMGNDPAGAVYVRNKIRTARRIGMQVFDAPVAGDEQDLADRIRAFNRRPDIHGFIVQLPLPDHISVRRVLEMIRPDKDADAFHPLNLGRLCTGRFDLIPATPAGILALLEAYDIPTRGRRVVIAGRSRIVGRPLSVLLSARHRPGDATVTLIHSATPQPEALIREADIFVSAIGRPHHWKASMFRQGVSLIDVGISRRPDGKLAGDIDPQGLERVAAAYTPVPGGVGPMTVAMLLENTWKLFLRQQETE